MSYGWFPHVPGVPQTNVLTTDSYLSQVVSITRSSPYLFCPLVCLVCCLFVLYCSVIALILSLFQIPTLAVHRAVSNPTR